MDNLRQEIEKRRTFAIISHPDAGKTYSDREVSFVRRGNKPGRFGKGKGYGKACCFGLDGDRKAERYFGYFICITV